MAVKIRVKGYLTFRQLVGDQEMAFDEKDSLRLDSLLEVLLEQQGEALRAALIDPGTGILSRQAAVLVNGRHSTHLPEGLETVLKDGDQVAIFPPLAGG